MHEHGRSRHSVERRLPSKPCHQAMLLTATNQAGDRGCVPYERIVALLDPIYVIAIANIESFGPPDPPIITIFRLFLTKPQ
jgi:hypothetical protein